MAALITELLGKGRLDYDYQPEFSLVTVLREGPRYGLTRDTRLGVPAPDPFWLPTPRMMVEWRRRGLGNFFRLGL